MKGMAEFSKVLDASEILVEVTAPEIRREDLHVDETAARSEGCK